jgi:hypothetical protein
MKYIVPLFRENAGRAFGLANWDLFQAGFRMVMRGDKFAGVTWDPWWRERKSGDRRKQQQRTIPERRSRDKTGHRLSSEGDSVQPLRLVHNRRANRERRNGNDRRKSASREKLVSVAAFIRGLGTSAPSDENARLLIRVWAGLTTREAYEGWKRNSGMLHLFFKEPEWTERENHEKFTDYAIASFFELLRRRSVSWKGPNPSFEDMGWVSRIVSVLGRASQNAKLQSIRAFFEGLADLERMSKILSGESLSEKREALLLVKANHSLKPKEFYAKLRGPLKDLGIELSSNPNSYPTHIERLKKQAQAYLATLSRNHRP